MNFSQRIGKKASTKEIQLESMDIELRNGLWNLVKLFYLDVIQNIKNNYKIPSFYFFASDLWHNFYKLPIDTIPSHEYEIEGQIRKRYFKFAWNEVYDFIEFIISIDYDKQI